MFSFKALLYFKTFSVEFQESLLLCFCKIWQNETPVMDLIQRTGAMRTMRSSKKEKEIAEINLLQSLSVVSLSLRTAFQTQRKE